MLLNQKTSLQADVDAAALAGASALPDADNAKAIASEYAQKNGLDDDTTLAFNTPYKGDPTKIEVVATTSQPFIFARVLGKDSATISARAVAMMTKESGIDAAFLALNPTMCGSFDKNGNSDLEIIGPGGIMVNSSCDPSINRTGIGSVTAAAIQYYEPSGYNQTGSGSLNPLPVPVAQPISDPLANLPPPDLAAIGISPDSGGTAPAPKTKVISGGATTLRPGVYYGGIDIRSSANVTFLPGTYVLAGGGFKVGGSGTIKGDGVTFYNTYDPQKNTGDGACGAITIAGTANTTFTAPTSGTYKNIGIWQDKACTNEMSIAGGQGGTTGVIYAPTATVKFVGSGALGSIQVVADSFNIAGTGDLTVNFIPFIDIPLSVGIKLSE
jgi:hypothetical protein